MSSRKPIGNLRGNEEVAIAPRASDASYRLLFEKHPTPMWVFAAESLSFLAVNEAAINRYGYSRAEFLRMTIRDIGLEKSIPALADGVASQPAGYENSTRCTHLKKDGTRIDVEIAFESLVWFGKPAMLAMATDVTERKRTEERLNQSEKSYRQFVEQSPDAVLVHRQGQILFANKACVSLFGATTAHELLGLQMFEFVHPDDREGVRKRIREYDHDFTNVRHNETRLIGLNGKETYTEVVACSIDFLGKPAMQVAYRDISQRKQAEKKLQESEASLAAAQRIAHLGSWERDLIDLNNWANNPLRWSDEIYRILGYGIGEVEASRANFERVMHPDDRVRVREVMATAIRERKPYSTDYRIILPNGSQRALHSQADIVYDEKAGKPLKIVGIVQDVTEQKQAEERFRGLLEAAPDAIVITNREGKIVLTNRQTETLFGYTKDELLNCALEALIPEGTRARHRDLFKEFFTDARVRPMGAGAETSGLRKDGSNFPAEISLSPLETEEGVLIVTIIRDITERKKAEEKFYKAFHVNPEPITIATVSEGRYIDVNESFLRSTEHLREEVIGHTSVELKFWERLEDRAKFIEGLKSHGSVRDLEINFITKSGVQRMGMVSGENIEIDGQACVIAIIKDLTNQKALEKQLRQSQKMEAIGQLSGGIAHDFNNLLGVIIGYSEILEERLPAGDSLHKSVKEIKKAGQRAASLTRQLLAFSRQQVLEPKILHLNAVVSSVQKMLGRLIGENIQLESSLEKDLGNIKADQGQIEQVILNLAVNARDAMPQGGRLTISTANVDLDDDYARVHPPQPAGRYVLLSVTDTGTGMDAATQAHIFEPFFTTKDTGKGTGLGLSTVYGVIRQSGGHIWVYSELGFGTTFKIFLPRTDEPAPLPKSIIGFANSLRGTETILLVEDEEPLRELTRSLLADSGYTVLSAEHPADAIEIAREYKEPIHLLLTDVVMPGMSGVDLAAKLAAARPEMKIIYMSGYTGFTHPELFDADATVLFKPVPRDTLLRKVHEVLAADVQSPAV